MVAVGAVAASKLRDSGTQASSADAPVLPVLQDLEGLNISSARQSVTIGKCGARAAALLGYPMGDPVANVRRTLLAADGLAIYFAEVVYRGDCIRFDMDLRP